MFGIERGDLLTLRGGLGIILGVMSVNGKTADQMREEFYAALRQNQAAQLRFEEEMRAEWKKITGEWGRFANGEGGMVEYEGITALRDLNEIGGMPVTEVVEHLKLAKKRREYDGLIQCPNAVVLLEFKRRLTRESVQKFLDKQLREFPQDFAGLINGKKLYGAVVGAAVDDDAKQLAEDNGLFAIRIPANRRAEVLNDEGKAR